ncbi:MAG: NPCBM/NEW2 domain-containing protein, partial [Bacilli bacterium]|nr:NPCBM/NEW2 domain-containing protein [Bacilli bacterium]
MVCINLLSRSTFSVDKAQKFIYLSEIDYVKDLSSVGWGSISINKNPDGGIISLIIDGQKKQFLRGIGAHAPSNVVYDISGYDYDYLTTYVGLDASKGSNGNGIKLHIFTSMDGTNWDLETPNSPEVSKGDTEAIFYKVDIKGKKYIKLYANHLGNNTADHAVYANAKLIKADYVETNDNYPFIKTVEEYDKEIKKVSLDNQLSKNEHLILKREFVKNVGYDLLQQIVHLNDEYKETVEWLFNDVDNLRLYIMGGTPAGSYYNSITQLSRLYHEYGEDFKNTKLLNNKWYPKMTYGDLYKKMAITLSLTHSETVALWMHSGPTVNQSDALRRYAIFKYLHDDGKLKASSTIDLTDSFEALQVEEMRFIMNNAIDDEEILWLNAYVKTKIIEEPNKAWLTPHPHMAYVWPDYTNNLYYENDDYFNDLFKVKAETINTDYVKSANKLGLWDLTFVIPGGKSGKNYEISITKGTKDAKISKVWMNFRNKFGTGAVCGGISKSGSNIRATHGIPATVIGQPGHAALLFYSRTADGKGYWGIDNDVSGWTLSEKGERMLNGWGNANYQKGYSVVYMVLAQEALNDFENYTKSQELVKLANSYTGDTKQQEAIYRKALGVQSINIDAWYGLVSLYLNDATKTEKDYYTLAEEIAGSLKNFPLPMYHLTNLLKGKLTSVAYGFQFTLLQTRTLEYGSTTKTNEVLQPGVTNTEAKYLLGNLDKTLATFSFDGDDANKIVLADRFKDVGVRWDYSIDGKKNWKEVSFDAADDHKWLLTNNEIKAITEDNDIYVHIVGTNYSDENLYKIDITKGTIPDIYFANDLENRVVGVTLETEWKYPEDTKWTKYSESSPDLTGDKTVEVRIAPTGTKLASDIVTYSFTEDNQPITRKYIPVSHLSIAAVSTEATANQGHATNAIDANYNTRYHSAWNGSDTDRFMTIKLDKSVYLSAVEFVPAGGGNGKIYDGTIYGSMDGENWFVLSQKTGLTYTNQANTIEDAIKNIKSFEIANPKEVQYVKIVADKTNGNWFTARAFNLYQDLTNNPHPTAGVAYSTTEPTNEDVVARLVNASGNIKITNNGGKDTYTFTKNGEFEFKFVDKDTGLSGSAKAVVDWIDKTAPTAKIKYSTTKPTQNEVDATLTDLSEEVTIVNNSGQDTYTFSANGSFTFEIQDKAGNTSKIEAKVDWIDTTPPTADISYNITTLTNQAVTATLTNASEKIKILNNGGKNNYTFSKNGTYNFQIQDEAGNTNTITATVGWIDKTPPTAQIQYSTVKKTKNPVTATIKNFSEEVSIINNGGKNTYTFERNGTFTFEIKDAAGNINKITAKVNWIDDEAVTIPPRPTTTTTKKTTKTTTTNRNNNKTTTTIKNTSNQIGITNT